MGQPFSPDLVFWSLPVQSSLRKTRTCFTLCLKSEQYCYFWITHHILLYIPSKLWKLLIQYGNPRNQLPLQPWAKAVEAGTRWQKILRSCIQSKPGAQLSSVSAQRLQWFLNHLPFRDRWNQIFLLNPISAALFLRWSDI